MTTVAILGLGARGAETYGAILHREGKWRITALCDTDAGKRAVYGDAWGVPAHARFATAEALFGAGRLADVLVVATCDRDHRAHAEAAMRLGYHLLLEKPIAPDPADVAAIERTAAETGRKVAVCHVMRYTAYYQYVKRLLEDGTVGKIVGVNQLENVTWWHQAHAFVRGNFRSSALTSPMILQKCCHDMDLLVWLVGDAPETVWSVGQLTYFTHENKPQGSADRCLDCALPSCPYNAVDFYVRDWKTLPPERKNAWPWCMLCVEPTEEKLRAALRSGPYGRCVWACDNDVVDYQQATVRFRGGATGQLTMTGFTFDGGRQTKIMGTHGEIVLDEARGEVSVGVFGQTKRIVPFTDLTDDFSGHGGGDVRLIHAFYDYIEGGDIDTSLARSADSHYLCFAAEASRLAGGKPVAVADYRADGETL